MWRAIKRVVDLWQVSWLRDSGDTLRLPDICQWRLKRISSLTVAGAAMDSVPVGYASPCSLFISRIVPMRKNHEGDLTLNGGARQS